MTNAYLTALVEMLVAVKNCDPVDPSAPPVSVLRAIHKFEQVVRQDEIHQVYDRIAEAAREALGGP